VSNSTDTDFFAIRAVAGPLTVTASVVAAYTTDGRSDLDILLKLTDASGTQLATADTIATGWAGLLASLTATLPADGTYYISVQGTGFGNPSNTGYSAYGSIGQTAGHRWVGV
jgi:hypothetical protein